MDSNQLKEKLHQYIDSASDEELEEMMYLLEEDATDYKVEGKKLDWYEDEEFVKELDRRVEDFESGKDKGIPAEEVHKQVREMLDNIRKQ